MKRVNAGFVYFFGWMLLGTNIVTAAEKTNGDSEFSSLQAVMDAGGIPLKIVVVMSILALFLVLFYLFTFRAGMLFPSSFLRKAEESAGEGDLDALRAACEGDSSPASEIIGAAVEQIEVSEELDYTAVRGAIEDEGSRQSNVLWQRLQYLNDIAVITPMIGLLGTVLGMMESFASLQTGISGVKPLTLSQGVAKALITTAGGLIVGIAAMILYALFRGRLNRLIGSLEETCGRILQKFLNAKTKKG